MLYKAVQSWMSFVSPIEHEKPIHCCNHCVECCSPFLMKVSISLDYIRSFVHHALPNIPQAQRDAQKKRATSKATLNNTYVRNALSGQKPSVLRRRRDLTELKGILVPVRCTNISDSDNKSVEILHSIEHIYDSPCESFELSCAKDEFAFEQNIHSGDNNALGEGAYDRQQLLDFFNRGLACEGLDHDLTCRSNGTANSSSHCSQGGPYSSPECVLDLQLKNCMYWAGGGKRKFAHEDMWTGKRRAKKITLVRNYSTVF